MRKRNMIWRCPVVNNAAIGRFHAWTDFDSRNVGSGCR